MNEQNTQGMVPHTDEPMIDARQASAALRLPYYWFADSAMRTRYRIPHYQLGGLVRYRMSELSAWAASTKAPRGRKTGNGDESGEDGDAGLQ